MAAFSLVPLVLATLFAGIALYISFVEHPARLGLDDPAMLAQWQPSYKRALPIQAGLAIAGGISAMAACYLSADWRWAMGSAVLLANWPFTLVAMLPTNKRLQATPSSQADVETRQLLMRWGRRHAVRSVLGSVSAAVFAWALAVPPL